MPTAASLLWLSYWLAYSRSPSRRLAVCFHYYTIKLLSSRLIFSLILFSLIDYQLPLHSVIFVLVSYTASPVPSALIQLVGGLGLPPLTADSCLHSRALFSSYLLFNLFLNYHSVFLNAPSPVHRDGRKFSPLPFVDHKSGG